MDIQLRPIIRSVLDRSLSRKDESRLARVCHEIALTTLLTNFSRRLDHFRSMGLDSSQVAFLCIERLFLPREGTCCYELFRYLTDLHLDLDTWPEEELLIELRRLVYRKVQHTIAGLYEERDPDYGRILRQVKTIAKESPHFTSRESVLGLLVWKPEEGDLLMEFPEIPPDKLLAELSRVASPDSTIDFLMHLIFSILHNETQYRRKLPASAITTTLRRFYALMQPDREAVTLPDTKQLETEDLDLLANQTMDFIYTGCILRYQERGSLTEHECQKYRRAIHAFLRSRLDGQKDALFHCFNQEFPETTKDQYWDRYRNTFSYIAAKAWDDFEKRCKKYFIKA